MASRMYPDTCTWGVFVGCLFKCIYCSPAFQQQLKRWGKNNCSSCYHYLPHEHPERMRRIPSAKIVFVAGDGDISFSPPEYTRQIIARIKGHSDKTYYFQSKNPIYFGQFLSLFPPNVVLLTTLETNRDEGYGLFSSAPKPSTRYKEFHALDYPRKVLTVEPVMDFDLPIFAEWIMSVRPEYVWLGFNSRPKRLQLPDPTGAKVRGLIRTLNSEGIEVKGKDLRGYI